MKSTHNKNLLINFVKIATRFLFLNTLISTSQIQGQIGRQPESTELCHSGSIHGIFEVDPESGAASLYFPLGPGIGPSPVRYTPALVGRFAPQIGTQSPATPTGIPGPGLTLLVATAMELNPGHLDFPLASQDLSRNLAGARWTFPDGTGGRVSDASTPEVESKTILDAFGYIIDFEVTCGTATIQVAFEAMTGISPASALDDGLASPGKSTGPVPATNDRSVILRVSYLGIPSCPSYTVTAAA